MDCFVLCLVGNTGVELLASFSSHPSHVLDINMIDFPKKFCWEISL